MSGERGTRPGGDAASRSSGTALVVNSAKGQGETARAGWARSKAKTVGVLPSANVSRVTDCTNTLQAHAHVNLLQLLRRHLCACFNFCHLHLSTLHCNCHSAACNYCNLLVRQTPKSSQPPFFPFFIFFLGTDGNERKRLQAENGWMVGSNYKTTCFGKLGGTLAWAVSHCRGWVRQDRGRQLTASTEG